LVKKEPFSALEINKIKEVAHSLAFDIIYIPQGNHNKPLFQTALTSKDLTPFINDNYYDIRANTDDRPFFFQMLYASKIRDLFTGKNIKGQVFNYYGLGILVILLFISTALIIFFYILPLLLSPRTQKPSFTWGLYFSLLGLGFMLIEIPILQLGSVYLGSPTYGLSVGLFCLLFFGGLGSILCNYSQKKQIKAMLISSLILVVVLAISLPFYLHGLIDHTFGYNWYLKLILMVLMLFPTAISMGIALPSGLRLASHHYAQSIPWFWALNGAASVLGSIIAMAISMIYGYTITFMTAAVLYLLALGMVGIKSRC
jgi:hypothetical protein